MAAGSIHLCLVWILIGYVLSVNVYPELSKYFIHLSQVKDQFEYQVSMEEDFENGALQNLFGQQLLANLSLNRDEILPHYILHRYRCRPLASLPLFVGCLIFSPASCPLTLWISQSDYHTNGWCPTYLGNTICSRQPFVYMG